MSALRSCIYEGTVVHKRLVPQQHGFSYRVFTLCLDVDEIDQLAGSLSLFSRNRRNVFSVWDADFGAPEDGPVGDKVRRILHDVGLSRYAARVSLVCYPRIFGYVFNPLSVYFCRDDAGEIGAMIYEVTNTVGERKSYVLPTGAAGTAIAQSCQKEMYVSPFTAPTGRYGFHAIPPDERLVIGVNFRDAGRAVLKTHFSGERRPLSNASLTRLVVRYPLMTMKVITAIHFEAARLWMKGVPVATRRTSPSYSYTLVDPAGEAARYA